MSWGRQIVTAKPWRSDEGPDVVLVEPVEVLVVVAGSTLSGRDRDGVQVGAVGLGALQEADVAHVAPLAHRVEHVAQHGQVGVHLATVGPARHEAGLLAHGGVDDVGDGAHLGHRRATRHPVGEVDGQVADSAVRVELGHPARQRDHVVARRQERLGGGRAHEPAGPHHQDDPRCGF